ncbi:MAG: PAS domain-containing protein [Alphaproteobacteria bacterium]
MARLSRSGFALGAVFATASALLIGAAAINNLRFESRALTAHFEEAAVRTIAGIAAGLGAAPGNVASSIAAYVAEAPDIVGVTILNGDGTIRLAAGDAQAPSEQTFSVERAMADGGAPGLVRVTFDRAFLDADIARVRSGTYQRAPIVWAGIMVLVIALLAYRERTRRVTGDNRRLHDEILRRSEAEARERSIRVRLEDIAALTSDFYWETDANGIVRYVSDRFRTVTGVLDEFVVGKPIGEGRWQSTPETRANIAAILDERQTIRDSQFHYTDTKGRIRVIAASAAPRFDSDGVYIGHRGTSRDVTPQAETAQRVAESEERFRSIAEMSADLFWETDAEGRITFFVNRSGSRLALAPDVYMGTKFLDLVREVSPHSAIELEQIMAKRQSFSGLRQDGVSLDGAPRHLVANGRPIFGLNGTYLGYRGGTRDVTDLVEAEKRAARSARQIRAFFDNAPAAIIIKNRDLQITHVNGTYETWSGRALDTVLGKTSPEIHSDSPQARAYHSIDQEILATGRAHRDEDSFTFGDGTKRSIASVRFPILDDDGEPTGIGVFLTDITDQHKAQERAAEISAQLQQFLDNSPSAIAIKEVDGRFSQVNPAWCTLLGKSAQEVIGKTNSDIFPNGPAQGWLRTQDKKVVDAVGPIESEAEILAGDGAMRRISSVRYPLRDKSGRVTHIASISTDITQARNAEERLRQAHRMEAIGQLTGGVAHDFNNLLTVAQGNLELLELSLTDAGQRQRLEAAIRAVKRGGSLTQQLLSFARKQTLAPTSISVAEAVNQIGAMIGRVLRANIVLQVEIANDLPPIQADPAQLESALLNLALNAQDAMPRGGHLTLRADRDETNPSLVNLSVADTGTGIAEAIRERVLEPFFTTKSVGEGSGLGLSMVYGFVQQSGGYLEIQSEVGRGTEIVLSMPVARSPIEVEGSDKPLVAGKGRVLFVEDDPDLRDMAEQMIRALGYVVESVPDADTAARRLIQKTPFDILLTDLVLPGNTNGHQLAEFARGIRPTMHIVVTSGYADSVLKEEGDLPAGSIFLPKPFRMSALSQVLHAETPVASTNTEARSE